MTPEEDLEVTAVKAICDQYEVAKRIIETSLDAIQSIHELLAEYMKRHTDHAGGPNICRCDTCLKARKLGYMV